MKKSILILLAGTTLLAGCNLAPKYERPAGAVSVPLPQGGVYPAAPTDAQDVSRNDWRDSFLDDRPGQVIQSGISNNRALGISCWDERSVGEKSVKQCTDEWETEH